MVAASAITTLGALPPFLLGSQAVAIREDLGFGLGEFGVAVSLFFGTAALATITGSRVFDRLGRRWSLLLAGVLVATGGAAIALLVSGFANLLAAMVVLGLGNAACQAAANRLMARGLPPHRRGLGFGVKQSAVPVAIMVGGLAVPTVGQAWGWEATFAITATVGLLLLGYAVLRAQGGSSSRARAASETVRSTLRPPGRSSWPGWASPSPARQPTSSAPSPLPGGSR